MCNSLPAVPRASHINSEGQKSLKLKKNIKSFFPYQVALVRSKGLSSIQNYECGMIALFINRFPILRKACIMVHFSLKFVIGSESLIQLYEILVKAQECMELDLVEQDFEAVVLHL